MGRSSSPVPFLDRQEIEQQALDFAESTSESKPAWDAFDIARRVNIPVVTVQFDKPNVAGMLVRNGDLTEIRVHSNDPYKRQNFTVAHELGHHVLRHPGTWEDTTNTLYRRAAWDANMDGRRAEYQANLFAAALLMPETAILERWNLFRSVHYLAPYFRVSKEAVYRRLEDLRVIVSSPKDIHLIDISEWDRNLEIRKLPTLIDDRGPVPRFAPIATDELGRIIPLSDAEWADRSSALTRVLRHADEQVDEDPKS